jgi:hypothetical protein
LLTTQGKSAKEITAGGIVLVTGSPRTYSESDFEVIASGEVRGSKVKDDSLDMRKWKQLVSFGRTSAEGDLELIDSGDGGKLKGSTFHARPAADTCFNWKVPVVSKFSTYDEGVSVRCFVCVIIL